MKIATISHSHIHLRQQLFFKEIAKQGHEVLVIAPGEWGDLRAHDYSEYYLYKGKYTFITRRHMGETIYDYKLLDVYDAIDDFSPDWLYVQAEPSSLMAMEAINFKAEKYAVFTWENIKFPNEHCRWPLLEHYDLVICGNPDAVSLATPHSKRVALMLQVGIDTDHFTARPDVDRSIQVGFIGRLVAEKGLPYLKEAWPTVQFITGKDYKEIPWYYSQVDVLVQYSQDVPWWREQSANYACLEALSCGCKVVTSDTAAMVYWLEGCPGVVHVKGCEQPTDLINPMKTQWLKDGITKAIDMPIGEEGREWVKERYSNQVLAKKLMEEFENG